MTETASKFSFRGVELLPGYKDVIDDYVKNRRPVGRFFQAVISDELFAAHAHAIDADDHLIGVIAAYLHNETPRACHGSREAYAAWIAGKK